MDVTYTRATAAELIHDQRHIRRTRFRHFVRELNNPRAKRGVSHKQITAAKLHVIDGEPHVTHHGELVPVVGTLVTIHGIGCRPFVIDIRLDSEYLPSHFGEKA